VCKGRFEKTGVCGRPEKCKRPDFRRQGTFRKQDECKRAGFRRQVYVGGKRNVKGSVKEDRHIQNASSRQVGKVDWSHR
jgi:hypothetical protein